MIADYCTEKYGYVQDEQLTDVQKEEIIQDNNVQPDNVQTKKMYNVHNVQRPIDNIIRYQDSEGLLRRLTNEQLKTDQWQPSTGEGLSDNIGTYWIAANNKKVYIKYKDNKCTTSKVMYNKAKEFIINKDYNGLRTAFPKIRFIPSWVTEQDKDGIKMPEYPSMGNEDTSLTGKQYINILKDNGLI